MLDILGRHAPKFNPLVQVRAVQMDAPALANRGYGPIRYHVPERFGRAADVLRRIVDGKEPRFLSHVQTCGDTRRHGIGERIEPEIPSAAGQSVPYHAVFSTLTSVLCGYETIALTPARCFCAKTGDVSS